MSEPVIPKRCPCCRADLEHGVVVGMHIQGCELGAAEAKVAELEKIIAEPWEHTDHWRNPETGYVECECCCKWALDAERDHKAIAEQAATIERLTREVRELQPRVFPMACFLCEKQMDSSEDYEWHGLGNCVPLCEVCNGNGFIDAALSKQEPK